AVEFARAVPLARSDLRRPPPSARAWRLRRQVPPHPSQAPLALCTSRPVVPPEAFGISVVSRIFRTFNLAERHPALGHVVMAPLICWSFSNSMFRYLLVDHAVPAMWRSLAAARLSAD